MIPLFTLIAILSLTEASHCPGVISIRQDGPRVDRLHISQEGIVHYNDEKVDDLGSCVDHVETVSPRELIYIVNGTLYFRTIGKSQRVLDTEVSTATYDRRTCTIYWISRGKMFYEAFQTKRDGSLHTPVSPLHFYYGVGYALTLSLGLSLFSIGMRRKVIKDRADSKSRPLVVLACSE